MPKWCGGRRAFVVGGEERHLCCCVLCASLRLACWCACGSCLSLAPLSAVRRQQSPDAPLSRAVGAGRKEKNPPCSAHYCHQDVLFHQMLPAASCGGRASPAFIVNHCHLSCAPSLCTASPCCACGGTASAIHHMFPIPQAAAAAAQAPPPPAVRRPPAAAAPVCDSRARYHE